MAVADFGAMPNDGGERDGVHEHFFGVLTLVPRRHLSDDALLVHIKVIHAQNLGGYKGPGYARRYIASVGDMPNPTAMVQSFFAGKHSPAEREAAALTSKVGILEPRRHSGRCSYRPCMLCRHQLAAAVAAHPAILGDPFRARRSRRSG